MHDISTRAGQNRHDRRASLAAAVVAVLVFVALVALLAPRLANSAQPSSSEISALPETGVTAATPAASHDIAIQVVEPGREGLELTARLTDDGGLIERALSWTITAPGGETLYSAEAPEAVIAAPPGEYGVRIRYGAVELASTVMVPEGSRLMVSYVLNAGGMRILPRLVDIGLPAATPSSRIIALAGPDKGKLVAISAVPGEIIRLPAGDYKVESRFEGGNVTASSTVTVRAGRLSAVEIDHHAGLARLAFVGAPDAEVDWRVSDTGGQTQAVASGLTADLVLKPGTYTASAHVGGETLTATFGIAAGETRDIILGN